MHSGADQYNWWNKINSATRYLRFQLNGAFVDYIFCQELLILSKLF